MQVECSEGSKCAVPGGDTPEEAPVFLCDTYSDVVGIPDVSIHIIYPHNFNNY